MSHTAANEHPDALPSCRHGAGDVRRAALVISALRAGGGERVVAHLAKALRELHVHTDVVCLEEEGSLGDDLREQGISPHVLGSTTGWDIKAIARLRKLLKSLRPDVVNVHDRSSLPYLAAASPLGRWPIVYTAHGLLFNARREPQRRYRLALRWATRAVAVSQEVADRHTEQLRWQGLWDIIPNGVPDAGASPGGRSRVRCELSIPDDAIVFLAMGNVREEKGFEDLLAAADRLVGMACDQPFVCLIAGNLPDTAYCRGIREQREQLGLAGHVKLLGYRGDGDALRAAANAFVLSSRSEGLPMVVLEAMMAGLPIVATRVGGVPSALEEGHAGLLADPRDPDELAGRMAELLTDADLRARLGSAARERALAEYSVRTMARRYLETYAAAVSVRRGGGRG